VNAAILSALPAADFYSALAFRASDGMLVGGDGALGNFLTIDPLNAKETPIGNTGLNFVRDLDLRPVPEPRLALFAILSRHRFRGRRKAPCGDETLTRAFEQQIELCAPGLTRSTGRRTR
jgi:hypothetical protein